jgi:Asp-tRNA(Asn)/Glu-tRNA(Gln) amidotransferase A subunit family amidase
MPFSGMVAVGNVFNVTGHPVLTLPVGQTEGLPLGLQLIAGLFREDRLYMVGRALEAAS